MYEEKPTSCPSGIFRSIEDARYVFKGVSIISDHQDANSKFLAVGSFSELSICR